MLSVGKSAAGQLMPKPDQEIDAGKLSAARWTPGLARKRSARK
jgi:hypothetical protein